EDFEFEVTSPQVILREENGQTLEPFEELTIDVADEFVGAVMQKLGLRKAIIQSMDTHNGMTRLVYIVPTRGLLGYRSEFLTDTRGMGVMNYIFHGYQPYVGEINHRSRGAMVCMEAGRSNAYALWNLQERGTLFMGPNIDIYAGEVIGEHCREGDLIVNPCKAKKLTNVRASGSDEAITLIPPRKMSLEDCIAFINEDELVEVTPKAIRLRKKTMRKWYGQSHT
ncbi:MAG: translational GTPase TypA, partial [Victivallales bacterium]|nr:translational GTPase TypA [Victivallales bacterium]